MVFCDECNRAVQGKRVPHQFHLTIQDRPVSFTHDQLVCEVCGNAVYDEDLDSEVLARAKLEYQLQHGMSAQDMRQVREQYRVGSQTITQELFAQLLNLTLRAVQKFEGEDGGRSKSVLKIYADLQQSPEHLIHHFQLQERYLAAADRKKVQEALKPYVAKQQSDGAFLAHHYGGYAHTEYSGYTSFQMEKLKQVVLYLTRRGLLEQELAYRLWLADTCYFKKQTVSITGLVYTRWYQLPGPLDYRLLLAHLEHAGVIRIDPPNAFEIRSQQQIIAMQPFEERHLDPDEWQLLKQLEDELLYTKLDDLLSAPGQYVSATWLDAPLMQPVSYKVAGTAEPAPENDRAKLINGYNKKSYVNLSSGALRTESEFGAGGDYSEWMVIDFSDYIQLAQTEKQAGRHSEVYQQQLYAIAQKYQSARPDGES